jgi:CubicO group peptidase (beta-lactamase class C family)
MYYIFVITIGHFGIWENNILKHKSTTMNRKLLLFLLAVSFIQSSCQNNNKKILGYWEATFSDSIRNPKQYLEFKEIKADLVLFADEPKEDWLGMKGEKLFYYKDSLHFEKFWGIEKYDGKFLLGDTVISGFKQVSNKKAVAFTLRRITGEKLTYKIPRVDQKGEGTVKYNYIQPTSLNDNISCANLTTSRMDTLLINKLVTKILNKEISNIHSLLILKDNKLVLEEYFYNNSRERSHRVMSVTKSFTSALMGLALDKHFLPNVDEPVSKYFKGFDQTNWIKNNYNIRIRDLLTMSAGLDWKGLSFDEPSDDSEMFKTKDYFTYILNRNLKYTPGTHFYYNNGLSIMLGHILETLTHQSTNAFAEKYLFNDLGIRTYSWDVDDNGVTRTEGGLKLRSRDMMKFGLLYLNKGKWNGKQLISEDWINTSTSPKMNLGALDYCYHWRALDYSINHQLYRTFFALGWGEQAIIVVPEQKLIMVMTAGNFSESEHRPFEIMANYILPSLSSGKRINNDFSSTNLKDFVGEYRINHNESIKIALSGNALIGTDPSGVPLNLIQRSPSCFEVKGKPQEVYFVKDAITNLITAEVFMNGKRVDQLKKIN